MLATVQAQNHFSQEKSAFAVSSTEIFFEEVLPVNKPDSLTNSLKLFHDVPGYFDPEIDWLDSRRPQHPHFEDANHIGEILSFKDDVLCYMLEACGLILGDLTIAECPNRNTLLASLEHSSDLWRAVLSAQHYQVIYFVSRLEARQSFRSLMSAQPSLTDAIDAFLRSHNAAGTRAMNFAVHAFITRGKVRVDHASSFIPPNAIASIGTRHVTVREQDFARSPAEVLAEPSPMWDLHDFAHLTSASLCPELYGNKYQTHLAKLPKPLTALVRSPGMKTARGPKMSDGLLFSELLTPLFTTEMEANASHHTYETLTTTLASKLSEYLLGRRQLHHLSTGMDIMLDVPISPTQLAVLVQNKAYELTASEIEQRVFTRGGPPTAVKQDMLLGMTARERVNYLAESKSWLYFEVRNTIKHRAHKRAYRLVGEELLRSHTDLSSQSLLEKAMSNLAYADWEDGHRLNLWDLFA